MLNVSRIWYQRECELGISIENLNKGYNENDKSRVEIKYNPLLLFLHF